MSLFGGSVLLESENFLAGLEKAAGHQNQPGDYCTGFGKQFAGPADFFTGPVFFYAGSAFSIADVRVFFPAAAARTKINQEIILLVSAKNPLVQRMFPLDQCFFALDQRFLSPTFVFLFWRQKPMPK